MLRYVAENRFLRSDHLARLSGISPKALSRRLYKLYHGQYLDRPRSQLATWEARRGSKKIVYAIGNKGAEVLRTGGVQLALGDWTTKNAEVKRDFIEHTLGVADVRVAFAIASAAAGLTFDPWLASGEAKTSVTVTAEDGDTLPLSILPDAFFSLADDQHVRHFFLEYDTGSMPVVRAGLQQTSIWRKLLAYYALWQEDKEHRKGKRSTSALAERFGIDSFRVLFVTSTLERIATMRQAVEGLPGAHELFWFATADQFAGETPADPFEAVWWTSTRETPRALLDD